METSMIRYPVSNRYRRGPRQGIILLVVLATLTFFSVLLAAYLVFSRQSRTSSIAIALRDTNEIDPNPILNEALMTLIRGTGNVNDPFFGEDILSDFYGRSDRQETETTAPGERLLAGSNFAVFRTTLPVDVNALDDEFTGRIATFLPDRSGHPLAGRSFEIIRSVVDRGGTPARQALILNVPQADPSEVPMGVELTINGNPRNSPEIGFDGTNVAQTAAAQTAPAPTGGLAGLPASIQPNHLGDTINKSDLLTPGGMFAGDFDEPYDAADHNNWFLSHRREDGSVIPSFHRPAVINYLLNQPMALSRPDDLAISIARGTFRPIQLSQSHDSTRDAAAGDNALNEQFTGGNASFGLRLPLDLSSRGRLNQLANALIRGPWDVDNDADGTPDSVWIDIGLPTFTSQEGKLLRPLVAPLVIDLGGRLNVNAHGNYATTGLTAGTTGVGSDWPGNPATPFFFVGKGAGPADINIPHESANVADLEALLAARYQSPIQAGDVVPGDSGVEGWSLLRDGPRPRVLNLQAGYNGSIDPYGRSVLGLSPSGGVQVAGDGTTLTIDSIPDAADNRDNNPYEFGPSQPLRGDSPFTVAELEVFLRQFEFDVNALPDRLRNLLSPLITSNPDLARSVTTISKSHDGLPMLDNGSGLTSPLLSLAQSINTNLNQAQVEQLIAPEIRLGRKIDLNRRIGNGIDDAGSPAPGVIDEPAEVASENQSFASSDTEVNNPFFEVSHAPDYSFGTAVDPRQLLARHLYVLMMTVSEAIADNYPTFGDTMGVPPQVAGETEAVIRRRFRARRLAQWAINVVDFGDPDSIMTPFEYDEDISDGWDVDGNLLTPTGAGTGLVWGVENPELLLTESLALHNLNVRDTNLDSSMRTKGTTPGDDEDTDQLRLPEGSLFLELYCTRQNSSQLNNSPTPANQPEAAGIPRELYNITTGPLSVQLDLDRTVQTRFDMTTGQYNNGVGTVSQTPVWRIAISQPHPNLPGFMPANAESPLIKRMTHPDRLTFQPEAMDAFDPGVTPIQLDRFILFNQYATNANLETAITPIEDMSPGGIPAIERVFFNRAVANPVIGPEEYLSIAPRAITRFGSRVYGGSNEPAGPSDQRFEILADGLIQFDQADNRLTPNTANVIRPGRALILQGIQPPAWTTVNFRPGVNVSEPLPSAYYQEPGNLLQLSTDVAGYPNDSYVRLTNTGTIGDGVVLDEPQDIAVGGPIDRLTQSTSPGAVDPMQGSVANYRTAFLQRLANPTAGYDPIQNPYRTIDQIAIDLTVFSGEAPSTSLTSAADGAPTPPVSRDVSPGSRQKNGIAIGGSTPENILFSYQTTLPASVMPPAPVSNHFEQPVETTVSFLNSGFGPPVAVPGLSRGRPRAMGGSPDAFPFAMQTFLNRPYASPLEVMMVPASSQARLLEEFTVAPVTDPNVFKDFTDGVDSPEYAVSFISPFRHLLNFFHAQRTKTDSAGVASPPAAEFAMVLDFLTAGARYRDEESYLVRDSFAGTRLDELFTPPFNKLVSRDLGGRINLNTLSQFTTYQGLMQGHMIPDEFNDRNSTEQLGFDSFLESRRGYAVNPGSMPTRVTPVNAGDDPPSAPFNYDPNHLDPEFPTEFAGVFKPNAFSEFAIELGSTGATGDYRQQLMRRRSSDAGLLRPVGNLVEQEPPGPPGSPLVPLLTRSSTAPPLTTHLNRTRDAAMRYQTLARMPNLVSDNSQVFAIWLTMGLFEVNPNDVQSVGRELDADQGNARRFKALFIVDRSIPVGFIPGQDLNARDIVIFERFFQ